MSMILNFGTAICAVGLSFVPAYAQSQYEMDKKAAQDFLSAERKLGETYTSLMKKISPIGRISLEKAQHTWLQYRDQECAFETMATLGGSIHKMVLMMCKLKLNNDRITKLAEQLSCQEGDLTCGGQ